MGKARKARLFTPFFPIATALLLTTLPAFGSIGRPAPYIGDAIRAHILKDIHANGSKPFDRLLSLWEQRYGTLVVPALVGIARDSGASDPDRYVALMGAAKIGGRAASPLLAPLLKDPSWMVRDGTLRALSALDRRDTAPLVLPLLHDPALVVRLEAIQSVEKLKPEGAAVALLGVVSNSENYHHGKAQWAPEQALQALVHLKTQGAISASECRAAAMRLSALLENRHSPALSDPSLRRQIAQTARALRAED